MNSPLSLRLKGLNLEPSGETQIQVHESKIEKRIPFHLLSNLPAHQSCRRSPIRQIKDRRNANLGSSGTGTPRTPIPSLPQGVRLQAPAILVMQRVPSAMHAWRSTASRLRAICPMCSVPSSSCASHSRLLWTPLRWHAMRIQDSTNLYVIHRVSLKTMKT